MARTSAIKLLLIGFNDDNAEDIISTFRRAGKVAHSKLINDGKELQVAHPRGGRPHVLTR